MTGSKLNFFVKIKHLEIFINWYLIVYRVRQNYPDFLNFLIFSTIFIQNITITIDNNDIYSKCPPLASMQAFRRLWKLSTILTRVSKVISFQAFFKDSTFG